MASGHGAVCLACAYQLAVGYRMAHDYSFGAWIRKRRRALGLTQSALAERVGYSPAMIRKIESDERRPSTNAASLLAVALEIPPEQQDAFLKAARHERSVDHLGSSALQEEPFPWEDVPKREDGPKREDVPKREDGPQWEDAPQPHTNLPVPATLLVGRDDELARLDALLADPACRLVTLVGMAGIGKTRLAIQAAHRHLDRYADGLFFVSLAPLDSTDLLVTAIASAIGLQFHGATEPQEQLMRCLQGKQMLLVLDNFEHLMEGATQLAELIQAAPEIQLLVTSLERLNLQGEWVFEVEALRYPSAPIGDVLKELDDYGAVQLFRQCAVRIDPQFSLSDQNRLPVARICHLTEGIPLAIELAAAWVRVLSCQQIAREVESNLDFLKASARDLPARHQSLRAALDHSWMLLTDREKMVLRRLSVFRGAFRREGAQQVAGASLEEMASLLDKSLLKRVGEERYDLHGFVRQYAAAYLHADAEELASVEERHSNYYVSLLAQWESQIRGPAQAAVLAEMELELEDVRLAWQRMATRQQVGSMKKALHSLLDFYELRARFREGAALFGEAVAALQTAGGTGASNQEAERLALLGQVMAHEAYFWIHLDHYQEAAELLRQSLELLRAGADQTALAEALLIQGYLRYRQGLFVEARQCTEESLALSRAAGHSFGIVFGLLTLAYISLAQGAYEQAYALSNESLAICRDHLGVVAPADTLITLSAAARHLSKYDEAARWAEECLQISRTLNDRWSQAQTLRQLGLVRLELGEVAQAEAAFRQSILLAGEIGDRALVATALIALGLAHRASNAPTQAQSRFLEALQTAVETRSNAVALQALAEIAQSAMGEGANDLALQLAIFGLRCGTPDSRLKARWEGIQRELEPQFNSQQVAAMEERVNSWTMEGLVEELRGGASGSGGGPGTSVM